MSFSLSEAMKSKAHISTHPLHPMLVAFPFAFFTGAFIFDLLAFFLADSVIQKAATLLIYAGLAGGLAAAVPGIIDFIYTVPPASSAKNRAATHGLLNSSVMVLFVIALVLREHVSPLILLLTECLAIVLLFIAGWMGGTLVNRNQIGIYHRYAGSGKWKEVYLEEKDGEIEIAGGGELKVDQMMLIHISNARIVLARTETGFVAFSDRCTHKGGSLAGGTLICGTVQCPWHGSQFSVTTGAPKAGPATEQIRTFPVSASGGRVYLHWRQA